MYTYTHAVAIGRFVMGLFWMTNPPEIYTAAIGLYSLWLIIRVSISLYSYVTDGALELMSQVSVSQRSVGNRENRVAKEIIVFLCLHFFLQKCRLLRWFVIVSIVLRLPNLFNIQYRSQLT